MDHQYGNFMEVAETIQPVDIVTLDRVLCCYPDLESLLGLSSQRAARVSGVVFPVDSWAMRVLARLFTPHSGCGGTRSAFSSAGPPPSMACFGATAFNGASTTRRASGRWPSTTASWTWAGPQVAAPGCGGLATACQRDCRRVY